MDGVSIFAIVFFIALGVGLLIAKFKEKNKLNDIYEEMEEEVDKEDFEKEKKASKNLKINKMQKEVFFTKNYIEILVGEHQGRVFKSKRIYKIYHYVYKVQSISVGIVNIQKTIMIRFNTDVGHAMLDVQNTPIVKKYKYHKAYEFSDDLIYEIIKLYPWVEKTEDVIEIRRT